MRSASVHDMFDSIAHRYDLANDVLSAGTHRFWRKALLKRAGLRPGMKLLDLCTGTGEVARDAARSIGTAGEVVAVDFVQSMLDIAQTKAAEPGSAPITYVCADASKLPLPNDTFDAITIAYGIRNVESPLECLREMIRVTKSGARVAILEFGQPTNVALRSFFGFYCRYLMPRIGSLLTGNRQAYEYLPETSAAFPAGEKFLQIMREAGFRDPKAHPLFGGIAYVYSASRAETQD